MIVSVTKAAKLVRKHRSTLYNHNEQGRLTFTKEDDGSTGVDVVELQRVYGKLHVDPDEMKSTTESTEKPETTSDPALVVEIERLKMVVKHKDEMIEEISTSRDRWERETQDWKDQATTTAKLLEHQAKPKRRFFGLLSPA